MWRIYGLLFFGDKDYFLEEGRKAFSRDRLVAFLQEDGRGPVRHGRRRLSVTRGMRPIKFLEVVTPVDLDAILERIPGCRAIVTTGQKATDTLLEIVGAESPRVGGFCDFMYKGRALRLYRMPSVFPGLPEAFGGGKRGCIG